MFEFVVVDVVCVAGVAVSEMKNMALIKIEKHLPFRGPLEETVETLLKLSCIIIVVNFVKALGVISKLDQTAMHHIHSCVDVIDEDNEQ